MSKVQEINRFELPPSEFDESVDAVFENNDKNSEDLELYSDDAMDCAFFDNHPELNHMQ